MSITLQEFKKEGISPETARKVQHEIADGPKRFKELDNALDVSDPTISKYLNFLSDKKMVEKNDEGAWQIAPMTETDKKVLSLLDDHRNGISLKDMADDLDLNEEELGSNITKLQYRQYLDEEEGDVTPATRFFVHQEECPVCEEGITAQNGFVVSVHYGTAPVPYDVEMHSDCFVEDSWVFSQIEFEACDFCGLPLRPQKVARVLRDHDDELPEIKTDLTRLFGPVSSIYSHLEDVPREDIGGEMVSSHTGYLVYDGKKLHDHCHKQVTRV